MYRRAPVLILGPHIMVKGGLRPLAHVVATDVVHGTSYQSSTDIDADHMFTHTVAVAAALALLA